MADTHQKILARHATRTIDAAYGGFDVMPHAPKLTEDEIQSRLAAAPEWSETGGVIQRTYQFKDFVIALRFVNAVAGLAEARQHHPDILIRWNKVTLSLSTHDSGGITHEDFDLAAECDAVKV